MFLGFHEIVFHETFLVPYERFLVIWEIFFGFQTFQVFKYLQKNFHVL